MSLNPSNGIAARANPGKTMFRNLARRVQDMVRVPVTLCDHCGEPLRKENWEYQYKDLPDKELICAEIDAAVRAELVEAGILHPDGTGDQGSYLEDDWVRKVEGSSEGYREVPCGILAFKYHWRFTRAWYYYVAKGPGIPPAIAEEFHKTWGTQCRAGGDCGCPNPLEVYEGFAVDCYHIDTQEGLNAFVKLLASIHTPRKKDE